MNKLLIYSLLFAFSFAFLVFSFLYGRYFRHAQNYDLLTGPVFNENYAPSSPKDDENLKVVTWNIKYSQKIDQAIAEMQNSDELKNADLILLQEMDEQGVDQIAKKLKYNYVYYPATVHILTGRNFGNAILSKWPLTDSSKLLLPYQHPFNKQSRIAVKATATIGKMDVLVYSVHTELIWLSQSHRYEQFDHLVADIQQEDKDYVILGGDFNTFTQKDIDNLTEKMGQANLARVSKSAGHTVSAGPLKFTWDHIFTKSFTKKENGVVYTTKASDHKPLWVDLAKAEESATP